MKTQKLQFLLLFLFVTCCLTAQEVAIYVSDAGNFNNPPWQILKFDENGENPEVFIDENLAWPQDIVFLEDDNTVLISSLNSGLITKHDATSGAFIENFASGIGGPTRMKIGTDNLLYVLQWQGTGPVLRYELDGTFVDEYTNIGVLQSIGLDWDSDGNLYVSSFGGDSVEKFDSNGVFIETFIDTNLLGPTNIWFEDNGDLLVIDYNGAAVKRFDSNGNYISDFISGISAGEGVDFFPNGDILIGDGQNSAVNKYSSDGSFLEVFVPSGSGNLITPNAVVRREVPPLSVEDQTHQIANIHPTVGTQFLIDFLTETTSSQIEIYTLTGQLIKTLNPSTKNTTWDASSFSEGIYFIKIELSDGSKQTQKVIVKRL